MKPVPAQVLALFKVLRKDADKSGYGWAISDSTLQAMAVEGATAVVNASLAPNKPDGVIK